MIREHQYGAPEGTECCEHQYGAPRGTECSENTNTVLLEVQNDKRTPIRCSWRYRMIREHQYGAPGGTECCEHQYGAPGGTE